MPKESWYEPPANIKNYLDSLGLLPDYSTGLSVAATCNAYTDQKIKDVQTKALIYTLIFGS